MNFQIKQLFCIAKILTIKISHSCAFQKIKSQKFTIYRDIRNIKCLRNMITKCYIITRKITAIPQGFGFSKVQINLVAS
jgi:hypothetical protein